jgi:hypothetical protein
VSESGDYRICFDNSASRFSSKVVFFDLIIEAADDDEDGDADNEEEAELRRIFGAGAGQAEAYEMQVKFLSMLVQEDTYTVSVLYGFLTLSQFQF